jgi:excisionase family DNA binding protein
VASEDGWLTTRQAAEYAGCSVNALHRAMAAEEVGFEQSCPGGQAWFKRSAIDAWRRSDGPVNA